MLATLGAAGIGVLPAMDVSAQRLTPVAGPEFLVLSAWQADALTLEVTAGSGIAGNALNTAFPTGAAPPLSVVLAGWMKSAVDPDARAAATLMGRPDFVHHLDLHFPMVVILLFLADLARHTNPPPGPSTATVPGAYPLGAGGRLTVDTSNASAGIDLHCGNISAIVEEQLSSLFNHLKVDPNAIAGYLAGQLPAVGVVVGSVVGLFASFWNSVVDLAQQTLQAVVDKITAPVVGTLRLVFGALALVTTIASYLKAWAVPVRSDPTHLVLSTSKQKGKLSSTIDPHTLIDAWPPELASCAQEYGVGLPTLAKPGDPVTWTVQTHPELVSLDHSQTSLGQDYQTDNGFTTVAETPTQVKGEVTQYPIVWFKAVAQRSEVTELADFARNLALSQLPGFLQPAVKPSVDAAIGKITAAVNDIVGVKGTAFVAVGRHTVKQPPGCNGRAGIPTGHYRVSFPVTYHATGTIELDAANGAYWTLDQIATGSGVIDLTSDGRTVNGTVVVTLHLDRGTVGAPEVGIPDIAHRAGGTSELHLKISGSATAPIAAGSATGSGGQTTIDIPIPVADPPATPAQSAPVRVGLHVTAISCSAISGDALGMFREQAAQINAKSASMHMTISGNGSWTAARR